MIEKKTLKLLQKHKVDPLRVFIFVADETAASQRNASAWPMDSAPDPPARSAGGIDGGLGATYGLRSKYTNFPWDQISTGDHMPISWDVFLPQEFCWS